MNSLLKAILLAPAVVSAFVLPSGSGKEKDAKSKQDDIVNIGKFIPNCYECWRKSNLSFLDAHTMDFVRLDIGHDSSSANISPLNLRIDILHSTEACGFGNVTIDGQALSQTFDSESLVSSGKGSIATSESQIIVGSWIFDCIIIDGQQHGQLMKFMIEFLDGIAIENSGFSVLFRQTEETEIMNVETISFQEDQVIENRLSHDQSLERQHHNENGFEEHGHHIGHEKFNIHKEMAEVRYMKAQLKELKYLIHEKERHISKHMQENHNPDNRIRDCDSLRCVAEVVSGRARKFYGKIAGDGFDEEYFHHSFELQSKSQKADEGIHGKPDNQISKNHTDPHLPSHPHHILPICHYPAPQFHPHNPHHDGPHGPPPRGPPPHAFGPPRFDQEGEPGMHPFHEEEEGKLWEGQSRHHNENYGRLHGDEFDEEFERPHEKYVKPHHGDRPPFDNPEFDRFQEYHGKPPHERPFDGPEHERPHHPQDEGLRNGSPKESPHHESFENHKPGFDGPAGDHPDFGGAPPSDEPPHDGPPPHMIEVGDHGPPPHSPPGFPFHILKFALIGFLFSILIIALHRRTCSPKARSHRQACREERCKRLASCRGTKRVSFEAWWAWVMGKDQQFEEKEMLLEHCESDDDDDDDVSVSDGITSLRNAANVVVDMVAAEEGRSISSQPSSHNRFSSQSPLFTPEHESPVPHFDTYPIEIEETLPAYEDNDHDGSEASSLVADGFRYIPGSSDYSPSHSASGSVSDILGDKR